MRKNAVKVAISEEELARILSTKMSQDELEHILLFNVHGCLESPECSGNCMDHELEALYKRGVKPDAVKRVLDRWQELGLPDGALGTGGADPELTLQQRNLEYKYRFQENYQQLCLKQFRLTIKDAPTYPYIVVNRGALHSRPESLENLEMPPECPRDLLLRLLAVKVKYLKSGVSVIFSENDCALIRMDGSVQPSTTLPIGAFLLRPNARKFRE